MFSLRFSLWAEGYDRWFAVRRTVQRATGTSCNGDVLVRPAAKTLYSNDLEKDYDSRCALHLGQASAALHASW